MSNASHDTVRALIEHHGVSIPLPHSASVAKLQQMIESLSALYQLPIEYESISVEEMKVFSSPQWMKRLRRKGLAEAEIYQLVTSIGISTDDDIAQLSVEAIENSDFRISSKNKLLSLRSRLLGIPFPRNQSSTSSNSDSDHSSNSDEVWPRRAYRLPSRSSLRSKQSVQPTPMNGLVPFQPNGTSRPEMPSSFPPSSNKYNKLVYQIELKQIKDPFVWINESRWKLLDSPLTDLERILVLKRNAVGDIRDAVIKADSLGLTVFESYLNQVRNFICSTPKYFLLGNEIQNMRYNPKDDPIEFVRNLTEKLKQRYNSDTADEERILLLLKEKVPRVLRSKAIKKGANLRLGDMTNVMVHFHNSYKEEQQLLQVRLAMKRNQPLANDRQRTYRNYSNSRFRKPAPIHNQRTHASLQPNNSLTPQHNRSTGTITCHGCGKVGHYRTQCKTHPPLYRQNNYQNNSPNRLVENKPDSLPSNSAPVQPSSTWKQEKSSLIIASVFPPAAASSSLPSSSGTQPESPFFHQSESEVDCDQQLIIQEVLSRSKKKKSSSDLLDFAESLGDSGLFELPFESDSNSSGSSIDSIIELDLEMARKFRRMHAVTPRKFPLCNVTLHSSNDEKKISACCDSCSHISIIDFDLVRSLSWIIRGEPYVLHGLEGTGIRTVGSVFVLTRIGKANVGFSQEIFVLKNFTPKLLIGCQLLALYQADIQLRSSGHQVLSSLPNQGPLEIEMRDCNEEELRELTLATPSSNIDPDELPEETILSKADLTLDDLDSPRKRSRQALICMLTEFLPANEVEAILAIDNPFPESWPELFQKQISSDLNEHQKQIMLNTLMSKRQAFARDSSELGFVPHDKCNIRIDIGDEIIPYEKPYPCSAVKRLAFSRTCSELEQAGIISKTTAPGGSPALLVAKPDGSWRLVVDYRELNKRIKRKRYPMPRTDDFLTALQNKKYFATLDLLHGYYQLELPPEERPKTVFVTPDKKYQYNRLLMGLVDAPFYFQYIVNTMLGDLQYKVCLGYFDDICVFGDTFEELIKNLNAVLDRLIEWGFKIKISKTNFGSSEFEFLGHVASGEGIKPNPKKVEQLLAIPPPRNVKELQSFLGLINYSSRYIQNYAKIVEPLYRLVRKERKFSISPKDISIMETLKKALADDCMLYHFNPSLKTRLAVDASHLAVGGILLQHHEELDGWKPVNFFGQKLKPYQVNYTVSEKECLAIVVGIERNRQYLEGIEFEILTDHHALCQLPLTKFKNRRIERWSIMLSAFRYSVVYHEGKTHPADCLSRNPNEWSHRKGEPDTNCKDELFEAYITLDYPSVEKQLQCCKLDNAKPLISLNSIDHEESLVFKERQARHPQYSAIIKILTEQSPRRDYRKFSKRYVLCEGLLFRKPNRKRPYYRLMIDLNSLKEIFKSEHGDPLGGHFGFDKTCFNISQKYDHPGLVDHIRKMTASCLKCMTGKHNTHPEFIRQMKPIGKYPMQIVELDVMGPITASQKLNQYIVVMVDSLTRYVFAKAIRNQRSANIVKFLDETFQQFGYPEIVQTDQGRNFVGEEVSNYFIDRNIKHQISTPYHPQSQGVVERANSVIGTQLRIALQGNSIRTWDTLLAPVLFSINNSANRSTGFTPASLMFGNHLRKPKDLSFPSLNQVENVHSMRQQAHEKLVANQLKYVQAGKDSDSPIIPGKIVFVRQHLIDAGKKFSPKFKGPLLVLSRNGAVVTLIDFVHRQKCTQLISPNANYIEVSFLKPCWLLSENISQTLMLFLLGREMKRSYVITLAIRESLRPGILIGSRVMNLDQNHLLIPVSSIVL